MSDKPKKPTDPRENNLCAEAGGFLFSHPCGMFAGNQCDRCGKPVCNQHLVPAAAGNGVCTACSKLTAGAEPDNRWRQSGWWDDVDVDHDDYDRPTWYRNKRRRRSAMKDDFVDNDQAAFARDDGGNAGDQWEDNMGAS